MRWDTPSFSWGRKKKGRIPPSCVLLYSSPQPTGRCPPTLRRATCFTESPTQSECHPERASQIHPEAMFNLGSHGPARLTCKINHHNWVSRKFYLINGIMILKKIYEYQGAKERECKAEKFSSAWQVWFRRKQYWLQGRNMPLPLELGNLRSRESHVDFP